MTDEEFPFDLDDGVAVFTAPTMKQREDALGRLLMEAWRKGWDACDETYKQELAALGVVLQLPVARA
jgi:hypothetical protein